MKLINYVPQTTSPNIQNRTSTLYTTTVRAIIIINIIYFLKHRPGWHIPHISSWGQAPLGWSTTELELYHPPCNTERMPTIHFSQCQPTSSQKTHHASFHILRISSSMREPTSTSSYRLHLKRISDMSLSFDLNK